MRIGGVATAFPQYCYTQREVAEALKSQWDDKVPNPGILSRMMSRVGVEKRHFVLPLDSYLPMDTWGKANDQWIHSAVDLSERALVDAVAAAGLTLDNIGAIFFVSVTGIASPSIEARLINRIKLPLHVKRIPIFGLGCVAGAAGIARAADGTLFAHLATGRSLDRESDLVRAFRRRRRSSHCCGLGVEDRRSAGFGIAFLVLSKY
jgi:alkylresorcinol/alkylpyrone synthase